MQDSDHTAVRIHRPRLGHFCGKKCGSFRGQRGAIWRAQTLLAAHVSVALTAPRPQADGRSTTGHLADQREYLGRR